MSNVAVSNVLPLVTDWDDDNAPAAISLVAETSTIAQWLAVPDVPTLPPLVAGIVTLRPLGVRFAGLPGVTEL
jgi:hypothetical protein